MRSLKEAFDHFCRFHEVSPQQRGLIEDLWMRELRPYGKAAIRALVHLALHETPYRPRLPKVICTTEEFICPPADPVAVWTEAVAEARRSGPVSSDLHPAVAGALAYVGLERLRIGENPTFLKAEVDRYVAHYNAKPFHERAVLEGKGSQEQIKRLPSAEPWLAS